MTSPTLPWKLPWRALRSAEESAGLQRQLEKELTPPHPLWGQGAWVIGRRIDCDDIAAVLADGRYAIVHLVWDVRPGALSAKYPSTVFYPSLADFAEVLRVEAEEFGDADEDEA